MKQVLILVAHRPQRSPSQRYRFEQYLPYLEQQGYAFTYSNLINETNDKLFYGPGNILKKIFILLNTLHIRWKDIRRFKQFDIIFIQREALFFGTSYVEKAAYKSGAKVVFDFDDSIWLPDTSPGNKKFAWVKKPQKFFDTVNYAHVVIAGNAYLAAKANVPATTRVIPTTIDTNFHKPIPVKKVNHSVTIGWAGSISTLKHFETLIPVLQQLKSEFGDQLHIKLMGQASYQHPQLEVESVIWTHETEVEHLNSFDIGVMPLPNDEWAKGKCGLKALTYMACGVATVASAVGVNTEIIESTKNGFLVSTNNEWLEVLRQLILNNNLRQSIGYAGRQRVETAYSVQKWKKIYLESFNSLS